MNAHSVLLAYAQMVNHPQAHETFATDRDKPVTGYQHATRLIQALQALNESEPAS